MLEIKTFTFGPFGTNTYVVSDEQGNVLLIDPACYYPYEQQQLLKYIDVLVDGPFIQSLRDEDLLFRGSSNQRIIDVPHSRKEGCIALWEREE